MAITMSEWAEFFEKPVGMNSILRVRLPSGFTVTKNRPEDPGSQTTIINQLRDEITALRAFAQRTADQECVYLRQITDLTTERNALRDALTRTPAAESPTVKPNPFREFPIDRRRMGIA